MENEMENEEKSTIIKHLVLSGGGPSGLTALSILKKTLEQGFWSLENIKSIHATSVGTIVGILFLVKYSLDDTIEYLVKRPWNQLFKCDINQCINAYEKCGAFEYCDFIKGYEPVFAAMDLELDITLKEFYDMTQVELYCYSTEMNSFELECFSYKTHPNMKLLEASYASSCLPVVFQPLIVEDKAYIDGGIFLNYPIKECLRRMEANPDEVFGIFKSLGNMKINKKLDNKSNLFDYIGIIFNNIAKSMAINSDGDECKYQIQILKGSLNFEQIQQFLESEECRRSLVEDGIEYANEFINSLTSD